MKTNANVENSFFEETLELPIDKPIAKKIKPIKNARLLSIIIVLLIIVIFFSVSIFTFILRVESLDSKQKNIFVEFNLN